MITFPWDRLIRSLASLARSSGGFALGVFPYGVSGPLAVFSFCVWPPFGMALACGQGSCQLSENGRFYFVAAPLRFFLFVYGRRAS
jgi:hypothetical protein